MKNLLVLITALLATGCATSSMHSSTAKYCEEGDPAYDAYGCFEYWAAVNRSVYGDYRRSVRPQVAEAP